MCPAVSLLLGNCARAPTRLRPTQRPRKKAVLRGSRLPVLSKATTEKLLTKDDLVDYMKKGCKPRDKFRIGTEHEKFGFDLSTGRRLDYSQIERILRGLEKRFGWNPVMENNNIIGLEMNGQSISLEPGGQFELSGAPLTNLHQTCAEVKSHLYQVSTISEDMNVTFLGIGYDPISTFEEVPKMPKGRYKVMREYMPRKGKRGHEMMFRTCTVQVNLDFESDQDMIEKFRVGLALQPIANAIFSNSPFKERQPAGILGVRGSVWLDTDPDRCGNLPFVFDEDFGFEKYVDYALDVPMYCIPRKEKGGYIDAQGMTFREFMRGECRALPGELPTMKDWEDHLTTLFPDVRLKRFLEMRGADGGPWESICALPALWVGLLYDPIAQAEALDLISDWTREERDYLYTEVSKVGLKTPFRSGTVRDVAERMFEISKAGLERRKLEEVSFLKDIEFIVESGLTRAEDLLDKYSNEWDQNIDPILEEVSY